MATGIALIVCSGWKNWRQRSASLPTQNQSSGHLPAAPQTAAADDSPDDQSPLRGKPAPAFTLADLSGNKVSLSDFKGHPMLINFWGTYCPPCKIEMPWLQEFSKKYAPDGLQIIGITYDSEVGRATISKVTQQLGVTYPILLSDPTVETAYLSGTEVLPMSFYVDKTGKVIEVTAGQGSKDDLESTIKETLAAGAK
jgi:thiol-disulfide isomerase/thioredoxin